MSSHDWERFGEEICKTIQDAIEYGNYDRLNQTITGTVNQAADWVTRNVQGVKSAKKSAQSQQPYTWQGKEQTYAEPVYRSSKVKKSELYKTKAGGITAGILMCLYGYGLGIIFLIGMLMLLTNAVTLEERGTNVGAMLITMGIMAAGCGFMALKGTTMLTSIQRFKKYVKEIGAAEFCNITQLAQKIGKTEKFVARDVGKMIKKGWFRQGHFDKQKTCLIVTDEMYEQYQQLELRKELQQKEEAQRINEQRRAEQSKNSQRSNLSPEVQKVIAQGDVYIQKIRECNDAIPGEEISQKISHMEMVVDKIFDKVEKNPETISDIRKLMEYYLPTTIKLLEAYAQMDAQPVGGENIQTAKREIEATLDTLNTAFEKLLDSLFQNEAWDVSSDISVLNTMLAQEGLKEDGLKK